MFHIRIHNFLKGVAFPLIVTAFAAGAASAQPTQAAQDQTARFDRWGISFDFPKLWKEYGSDRVAMMKEALASQAKPLGIELKEVAMIVGPNEEIALLITKSIRSKPFQASDIVAERNQVYEDAKRAGDVTRVNFVKEAKIAGFPAVAEDVERSNGGRGRTYKMIMGKTIVEISFVVSSAQNFTKYEPAMDRVLATLAVADK